jgi:hypothetical protein
VGEQNPADDAGQGGRHDIEQKLGEKPQQQRPILWHDPVPFGAPAGARIFQTVD